MNEIVIAEKVVDNLVKQKWQEVIWPRLSDYIKNILILHFKTWESISNIIKYIESNDSKLNYLVQSLDAVTKTWFEKTLVNDDNQDVLLYVNAIKNDIEKTIVQTLLEVSWYKLWKIHGIIDNQDLTCEEKIEEIRKEYI